MITDTLKKFLRLARNADDPIILPKPKIILAYGLAGERASQRRNLFDWRSENYCRIVPIPRDSAVARDQLRRLGNTSFLPVLLVDGDQAVDIPKICGEEWPNFEVIDAVVMPGLALDTLYSPEPGVIQAWQALCAGKKLATAPAPWTDLDFALAYGEIFGRWLMLQKNRKNLRLSSPLAVAEFQYSGCRGGVFFLTRPDFPLAYLALRPHGHGWQAAPSGALVAVDADMISTVLKKGSDEVWARQLPADMRLFSTVASPSRIQRLQGTLDWLLVPLAELPRIAERFRPDQLLGFYNAASEGEDIAEIDRGPVVILGVKSEDNTLQITIKWLEAPATNPPILSLMLDGNPVDINETKWDVWSELELSEQRVCLQAHCLPDPNKGGSLAVAWNKDENRLYMRWISA